MSGGLYWFQHQGRSNGTDTWADGGYGRPIGQKLYDESKALIDWNRYARVFAAESSVIYGVDHSGALYWHQHLGRSDGTDIWAEPEPNVHRALVGVDNHWSSYIKGVQDSSSIQTHLFAADDGVIYGVDENGGLFWHQHLGRSEGTKNWNEGKGRQIGRQLTHPKDDSPKGEVGVSSEWKYKRMFAADSGVIYAVQGPNEAVNGRLYWFRHLGRGDGSESWAEPEHGVQCVNVGHAWNYEQVFAADDDVIYGVYVSAPGSMFWYRHLARSSGRAVWANKGMGRQVGKDEPRVLIDWTKYERVFAADDSVIYAVARA